MKPALLGLFILAGAVLFACGAEAPSQPSLEKPAPPLANAIVLVIRNAEESDSGNGLSSVGEKRPEAYVRYFGSSTVDGVQIKLTALFAAADSLKSRRSGLTLEPLSQALGLPIDSDFWNDACLSPA